MTTPGMLDPESFDTPEEFRQALLEDGLKQGWTPVNLEQSDVLLEDFLAHYGVRGMRWGVRRSEPSSASDRRLELAKINQKIGKIDADKALRGYGLRGWAAQKMYNKQIKKNPGFAYKKLSPEEKLAWQRKASRKVTRSVIERGAVEIAAVLGGGTITVSKMLTHPDSRKGAEIGVILLAGQLGAMRVSELNAIRTGNKLERLQARRDALGGRPK
jgi:hypothetical protein